MNFWMILLAAQAVVTVIAFARGNETGFAVPRGQIGFSELFAVQDLDIYYFLYFHGFMGNVTDFVIASHCRLRAKGRLLRPEFH